MITVREVSTKRDQREFLNFPLRLYKDEPNFVPPLYGDEKKIFRPDYIYYDTSEAVYFLAEEDDKTVGRISGILQKASNEKRGEKRIRFTRFDAVDRQEVADALFKALEDWGRAKGMTEICGPLGFSDLEREGLLVEGFEYLATFEEQYNFDYYGKLIEGCGFAKEIDWTESRLQPDPEHVEQMARLSEKFMERYKLHWGKAKNTAEFIDKYGEKFFELIDKSYAKLYGTVDFTKGMKDMLISNFKLVIKLDYVGILLDENEDPVGMGLCFPAMADALVGSGGHLYPWTLVKLLYAINNPKVIDLALIGVDPAWANRGVSVIICSLLNKMLIDKKIEYAETNLNLEDNYAINNLWKRFDRFQHKRRRSYVKKL
ncbi:MAG: hypothetical protein IJK77_07435 [Lachnospiraceae bacterium]|nr:hypothetical protein [Lachnospiraceae bacterium]